MARGKERNRLRGGRSGGRTLHAHSNIEGSSNADSAPFSNANIASVDATNIASVDANIASVEQTVHGIESQQPNQNVVAVSDTQASYGSTQDASTIDGRMRITVVNGLLEPSSKCARIITKKFKEKVDFEGYTWKTVTQPIRDFYFEEFRKHFIWDTSLEAQVKEAWVLKASQRYSDFLRDIRDATTKPEYLSEEEYKHWKIVWNRPTFKKKQEINSKNRRSVAGPSCHTGGSISNVEHGKKLESKLGRKATPHELFLHTHTKKHDGETFVDLKSKTINDKMLTLKQHAISTELESTNSGPTPVDELALYIEAVGGEKKRRVYGLGSQASSYYGCSKSNANNSTATSIMQNNEDLQNELTFVRNQLQVQDERHQHELQETREEMAEMRRMMQLLISQNQASSQTNQEGHDEDVDPTPPN